MSAEWTLDRLRNAPRKVAPVVTTSSTTSIGRTGRRGFTIIGRASNVGPRNRLLRDAPVCDVVPTRRNSRRGRTPTSRPIPDASKRAWSCPRLRRWPDVVGAQVMIPSQEWSPSRETVRRANRSATSPDRCRFKRRTSVFTTPAYSNAASILMPSNMIGGGTSSRTNLVEHSTHRTRPCTPQDSQCSTKITLVGQSR